MDRRSCASAGPRAAARDAGAKSRFVVVVAVVERTISIRLLYRNAKEADSLNGRRISLNTINPGGVNLFTKYLRKESEAICDISSVGGETFFFFSLSHTYIHMYAEKEEDDNLDARFERKFEDRRRRLKGTSLPQRARSSRTYQQCTI